MNIIIPTQDTKKFSQPNTSDLSGNVWYTKNINFNEKGYMKLSSRAVMLYKSDETNPANGGAMNMGYPFSFGRKDLSGNVWIATSDKTLLLSIADTGLSISGNNVSGGNTPVGAFGTRGKWWQNKFHVSMDTTINTVDASNTWATTGVSLTSGYPHPMDIFKNKSTLAVGNKNVVSQFETNYASSTNQLSLPTDYNVSCLAFSNNKMGIGTTIDSSLAGQNNEALFFIWDGASAQANNGYPVGSDAILAVVPYKSSWVILTKNGKLKYFNGGGFDTLATMPFFFKSLTPEASLILGDLMFVDGDLIYLNIPADLVYFGSKNQRYLENFVGGVLCYDPEVGLYHRYSPSLSKLYPLSVSAVSTTTGIFTTISGTIPSTGNPITYTSDPSNLIGGISIGTIYYVIKVDATHFKLALTKQDALDGNFIAITSTNSATFFALDVVDYGYAQELGSMAITPMGITTNIYDHILIGGYYYDSTTNGRRYIGITVPRFPNRGYAITPSITSAGMENISPKIWCKYAPLKETDSIIFKYKDKDVIGLPVTTPQRGKTCTWTSTTTFTTTADLSEAMNYLDEINELECEVITGVGAGTMTQISDITYLAGTYTVTLSEAIEGVVNGNACNVKIDNWKVAGTIDSDTDEVDKGWQQIDINSFSKKIKVKTELRGVETTIEELQITNQLERPS